jgi:hypothetical protein
MQVLNASPLLRYLDTDFKRNLTDHGAEPTDSDALWIEYRQVNLNNRSRCRYGGLWEGGELLG